MPSKLRSVKHGSRLRLSRHQSVCHNRTMSKRPTTRSGAKKGKDPYLSALGKAWPTILLAYHDFKDNKPIIEYRLRQEMVLAYPGLPYINDLTERTRKETRRIYADAAAAGQLMVFVRDTR